MTRAAPALRDTVGDMLTTCMTPQSIGNEMLLAKSTALILAFVPAVGVLSNQLDSASILQSQMEIAFSRGSVREMDDFFKQWESDSKPMPPDQANMQPEEVKQAYILIQQFYKPFKNPLQGSTLPHSPSCKIPYFVIPTDLTIRIGDSLLFSTNAANWRQHVIKEVQVTDFRPDLNRVDQHQLYLMKPYDAAVDSFLQRGSPDVRSKKVAFLSRWIKITTRYGGGLCSFPIVQFCHFDSSFGLADVNFQETPVTGTVLRYVRGRDGWWRLARNPIRSTYIY